MGIAFVLLVWLVFGVVTAAVTNLLLVGCTALATRKRGPRKALLLFSAAIPVGAITWLFTVGVCLGILNELVFDRDFGLGNGFHCRLPNGYRLYMIDVMDYATLSQPDKPSALNVRELQLEDGFVLGVSQEWDFLHTPVGTPNPPRYFLIDIQRGVMFQFDMVVELEQAAVGKGISMLKLEQVGEVYFRYRRSWGDLAAALVAGAPPLIALALLIGWILRVRRREFNKVLAFTGST
jgi:hypothetical protein